MKTPNSSPSKPHAVPPLIQWIFLVSIIAPFAVGSVFMFGPWIPDVFSGSGFSYALFYLALSFILPVIAFALAYAFSPSKSNTLHRTFEAMLLTVSGISVWSFLHTLVPALIMKFGDEGQGFHYFEYISAALFLIVYTCALIVLRKKKIWA